MDWEEALCSTENHKTKTEAFWQCRGMHVEVSWFQDSV